MVRITRLLAGLGAAVLVAAAPACAAEPAVRPSAQQPATSAMDITTDMTQSPATPPAGDATASASEPGTTEAGATGAVPASGTPESAAFPVTIHGASGDVTLAARPHAIVSLSPSLTEMLYAIGAGDQVIAVDTYSDYPTSAPRSDIDAYHLNIEALTAYEPDLVVAARLSPEESAQLASLGIPVLSQPSATSVDDTYTQITSLGQATGHVAEAAALVKSMRSQIGAIAASVTRSATHSAPPKTYYYELSQKLSSATSDTFVGQLLGLLGMQSIADAAASTAKTPGYPQLSAEFIIDAQPDYIFLSEVNRYPEAADVAARPGWSELRAVREGRVIVIDDDLATRWGPRIVDLLREVARAITEHPAP